MNEQSLSGAPASRMKLSAVTRGKQVRPVAVLLYGTEGIGKSTFGAGAPAPVFLAAEDGTAHLDVARFPQAETWQDALDAVHELRWSKHEYKTLVIDTLDWLEPLLWAHICKRDGQKGIEDYGYGKGYTAALEEWRGFTHQLKALQSARLMHVVLLAHAWIKPFKNPEGEDYDRYELKLNAKAAGLLKEWSEHVLFANYETFAQKDSKTKRVRGVSTGARMVYTQRRAAYDAKNRANLPESIPLSWDEFFAGVAAQQSASPDELKARIAEKLDRIPEASRARAAEALKAAGDDAVRLAQVENRLNATIAAIDEKGAA